MQQSNFQYLISAKLDGKGFEQTKQAVKEVQQTQDVAADKTEKATRKLTQGQRNLKDSIRGVALQFPILGRFAEAAINPLIGGIGLLVSGLTGAFFWLRDIHKTLADIVKVDAASEFTRIAQANLDAQLAAAQHARALERVQSASQSIADTTNEIVSAIQARKVAEAEIDDAQKALALARVNELEKTGTISATTAIQQRTAIEDAAAQRRVERENKAAREVIAARESELQSTRAAIAETSAALDRLNAQATALGTGDTLTRTLEAESKKQTALADLLKKQQATLTGLQATGGGAFLGQSDLASTVAQNATQLDAISRNLADLRADEAAYRAEIQATDESILETRKQLFDLTTRETKLQRDLPKLTGQAATATTHRARLLDLETLRRQSETTAATAVPVTAADQLQAERIIHTARTAGQGPNVMANIITQLQEANARNNQALLESIAQQLSRIYDREQITRESIQRRLDQLEADINRKLTYLQ